MTIGNFPKPLHITLLLITLSVVSAAANRILGSKLNAPALTTIGLEAEQGLLMPPMVINSTASASGGAYLSSNTSHAGFVTFSVDLATDGNYVIWGRVLAPDYYQDSFYVSIDGGPEDVYDVAHDTWRDSWQWTRVNGRAEDGTPLALNPRIFELSAGTHEIVFRAREPDTKLDRLIITNDLTLIADDTGPTPTPTPPPAAGRQFYVSPQGRPNGDGSQANPWAIWKAMVTPGVVPAGSTVYLRGGTYSLNPTNNPDQIYFEIAGTAANPIIVRNYPGERAIIDIDYLLIVYGENVHYYGIEFECSRTRKVSYGGWAVDRVGAINAVGNGLKFINNVFHDLLNISNFSGALNTEWYGNIYYYLGNISSEIPPPGLPFGNCLYLQNATGSKIYSDNIGFGGMRNNLQIYGSDASVIKNVTMEGNTIFNPGALTAGNPGFNAVVWVGSTPVENIIFSDNYLYSPWSSSNAVFWGSSGTVNVNLKFTRNHIVGGAPAMRIGIWNPSVVTDNTIVGNVGLMWLEEALPQNRQYTWNNNNYYQGDAIQKFKYGVTNYDFAGWKQATSLDTNSTYSASRPTGVEVFLRPNKYEQGRANITIFNWDLAATANVNLSTTNLVNGQQYEIRDAQNFFGTPVLSGTYSSSSPIVSLTLPGAGSPVTLIRGATDPANAGYLVLPVHTSKEFNAFVLLPR
jgi:hypothetical protein